MVEGPLPMNSSPINGLTPQGKRSLIEEELKASVAWLIRLRWLAGVGVILTAWSVNAILKLQLFTFPIYLIGAVILVYNSIFYYINKKIQSNPAATQEYTRLAHWQVGLDWLAMILLIHFSGGVESPAILFFVFHIIIAAIFFTPRTAYIYSLVAILLVWLDVGLEFLGILPHYPVEGFLQEALYKNIWYVLAILLFFGATSLISAYLAISINQRLRRREEEVMELTVNLQRATERLQALNDGARAISSTLELSEVLNRLVKNTAEVMHVHACFIRLLDKTGQHLERVADFGLSQNFPDNGSIDVQNNPLIQEVLSGKIVNIPDTSQTSLLQYPATTIREGIHSMLVAPLIGKSGPLGILGVYSHNVNHFSKDDETFIAAIAAQGSTAIENALAYQAIEALDATKSQFVRMVTHELRSPVSVIKSLLRTITAGYAGGLNEQQRDILERASKRAEALQGLVDDLLDLAAGKADIKSHGEMEPIRLDDVIEQVVKRFEISAKEKEIDLIWENHISEITPMVKATQEGLDRIFNNLVSNAIKYTLPKGKVTVKLTRVDNEACVTIEDTGIGISEEAQAQLFQEFYRAPNAKDMEKEGTGLGLVIVKDLVKRFGGKIGVKSTMGVGSQFTVILPLLLQ